MTRMDRFKRLWNKLERATSKNDVDLINTTIEEIERALEFWSDKEHNEWLDLVATFKDWAHFKSETFKIAQRGRNMQKDFEEMKSKIKGEGLITHEVKSYLLHLCYSDDNIEKIINSLRRDKYLRWW